MALKPLWVTREASCWDMLDADASGLLGGEVVSFTYITTNPDTDEHSQDVEDGYTGQAQTRPALTKTLVSGMRPLFLADEGTKYYGTLYGQVVGSAVGQDITTGAQLGPHTTSGSGKCTVWRDGMFAVTLDAVDTTVHTGLNPIGSCAGGDPLYATSGGLLTPDVTKAFQTVVVGRFIEFQENASKVTSTLNLTTALNSPVGTSAPSAVFESAVIVFQPEL